MFVYPKGAPFIKTKNHVHLQCNLNIPYIQVFFIVKLSIAPTISMIMVQVAMCKHKINTFFCVG